MPYVAVTPRDHSGDCRRGEDPCSSHYGLDRERCERCRNLWARFDEVGGDLRCAVCGRVHDRAVRCEQVPRQA